MFATCEAAAYVSRDVLDFGFQTCTHDCVGASLTDALLAMHALFTALRIYRAHGLRGNMGTCVIRCLLVNAAWSITGVYVWLQPGGERPARFDALYRLNGQCQAMLLFSWWSVFSLMLNGTTARLGARGRTLLKSFSTLHALVFSARALDCRCAFGAQLLAPRPLPKHL